MLLNIWSSKSLSINHSQSNGARTQTQCKVGAPNQHIVNYPPSGGGGNSPPRRGGDSLYNLWRRGYPPLFRWRRCTGGWSSILGPQGAISPGGRLKIRAPLWLHELPAVGNKPPCGRWEGPSPPCGRETSLRAVKQTTKSASREGPSLATLCEQGGSLPRNKLQLRCNKKYASSARKTPPQTTTTQTGGGSLPPQHPLEKITPPWVKKSPWG